MDNELKNLQLTEADFDMLIEGLEALPDKGLAGNMMSDLVHTLLAAKDNDNGDPMAKIKLEQEMSKRNAKFKAEKASKIEDVRILQGKLYMLKRHMVEKNLMKQANEVLDSDLDSDLGG
tara:strand:- start:1090 stop:1446 length:357 start_codon:yes stop_codon:yes gene_type:complete